MFKILKKSSNKRVKRSTLAGENNTFKKVIKPGLVSSSELEVSEEEEESFLAGVFLLFTTFDLDLLALPFVAAAGVDVVDLEEALLFVAGVVVATSPVAFFTLPMMILKKTCKGILER